MGSLTLTVVANMTSNYSEGLGNIASVQKVYKNGNTYSVRSRESMKNAIMVQSGYYDDLETSVLKGVNQKLASEENNAATKRALEGGYMYTGKKTFIRNSSFYLTDAISSERFNNDARFHNNLYMATNYANNNNINLQEKAGDAGLMPYQYEYEKSLKTYSITIDLDMIGKDDNFNAETDNNEKADRVIALIEAVRNLSLVVKGNLDNAEPQFIVGGISPRKTHFFENVVKVNSNRIEMSQDLKDKVSQGFSVALLHGNIFENEQEIVKELSPLSMKEFFDKVEDEVKKYYGV